MPKPIALCIELMDAPEAERFYKCTARTGREKGLSIRTDGTIGWCEPSDTACDLWVSDDQRLIAFRPKGSDDVHVTRSHRKILLKEAFMATLLHKDELIIGGRRYRIYVHGVTEQVHSPRLVKVVRAAGLAAAIAVSGAIAGCDNPSGASSGSVDTDDSSENGDTETDTIYLDAGDDSDGGPDGGPIDTDNTPPIVA